jgi:hypothetical protein
MTPGLDNFQVIERATDQVIKQFRTFDEAHKFRKSLQEGQAFDGWTPAFILQPTTRISETCINKLNEVRLA